MKKYSLFCILILLFITGCKKKPVESSKYVASTSWIAGIAEIAGINDVQIITPLSLRHPPEYEITPDDMLKIIDADIVMYAGYERMIKVISNAAEVDESKLLQIKTSNTLENITNMVNLLSEKAGTVKEGQTLLNNYRSLIEKTRNLVKEKGLDKKTVFVNVNHADLARDIGLNVDATFGTGNLTSEQIADIAEKKYDLIIDNFHNPVASLALEVCPSSKVIIWKNFPDKNEKNALYNVVKTNFESLFN